MKTERFAAIGLITFLLFCFTIGPAWADRRGYRDENRAGRHVQSRHVERGYVLDNRHHHNHYYPPRGRVFKTLPARHHKVFYRGTRYYYSGGLWYRPSGLYFSVIAPPIGVVVPVLPHYYTTVWYAGIPYYYAAGTYYRWYPEERGYIVTQPPENVAIYEEPEVPDELFVYPRAGQSEEMIATDRYECHRWAVDETGFDPTRPGGGVNANEQTQRRSDYNRANKACLEAREYSVQ
ncbi:MAG: hypothetical protein P8Y40_07210 [Desulfobacterales bacterium]